MTNKVANVKIQSLWLEGNRASLCCDSLEEFETMPNAVRIDGIIYYKGSYHHLNACAMYHSSKADTPIVYEVEEDVTNHPLFKPEVLIDHSETEWSWKPLKDVLEELDAGMEDAFKNQNRLEKNGTKTSKA